MKHSLPIAPQFYVTAPQPCPYLADKVERKLFTGLQDGNGKALNNSLSKQGFRRSQNVLYRPACESCSACISARIRVKDFKLSKSQKRIVRRNQGMERSSHTAWATEEQFDLFKSYLAERHEDGGMADMDMFEFAAMVEETPVRTVVVEYHKENESRRKPLMAACLTDVLEDGLSMVYSFFDTDLQNKSVGKYMILDHIEIAKEAGLDYIYLGYWVPGSPKMAYKSEFDALELFIDGEWQKVDDANSIDTSHVARGHKSILEQVASISLPEVSHKDE